MNFTYNGLNYRADNGLHLIQENDKEEYLDYSIIITLLHPNYIWLYAEEGSYQGDFFAIGYDDEGKFYFIQGSFGSCSGCDWLQSVDSAEEGAKLLNHFKKEIIMKPNREEMITYIKQTQLNVSYRDNVTLKKLIKALEHRYNMEKNNDA